MSLINDALKKAQRQQTGGAPAPAPGEAQPAGHTARVERREKPADFRSQMLILGGVSLGLLLALVVGGVFWWRGSHSSEPAVTKPVAQVAPPAIEAKPVVTAPAKPEPIPEPAKTEPAPATTTAAATTPQFTLPLAPSATTIATSTPPSSATTTASTAVQLPAATPAVDAVKLSPAERPKAPAQMIKAIEAFRVTGIRASGGESKVLMNDRVFRIGDTVDHDLGLKLTGVAQGALTFENAQGAVYTRNF